MKAAISTEEEAATADMTSSEITSELLNLRMKSDIAVSLQGMTTAEKEEAISSTVVATLPMAATASGATAVARDLQSTVATSGSRPTSRRILMLATESTQGATTSTRVGVATMTTPTSEER